MDIDYEQLAKNWKHTAEFHFANEKFYKDLLRKTGKHFGVAAFTSDDGSIQQGVLALKVPELVEELINKLPLVIEALEAGHTCADMLHANQSLKYEEIIENALVALRPYKNIQKYENIDENNCCGNCCE